MSTEEIAGKYQELIDKKEWESLEAFKEQLMAKGIYILRTPENGRIAVQVNEEFFKDNLYYERYQPKWDSKEYFVNYKLFSEGNWNKRNKTLKGNSQKKLDILERDNYTCQKCRSTKDLTMDHIIPWSISRDDSYYNLITLCWNCNQIKDDRIDFELIDQDSWIDFIKKRYKK